MTNPVGRPHRDLVQLAKDLLEWVQLEDSTNLCGFCGKMKLAPSLVLRWVKEDEKFNEAYEEAKSIIGDRREKLLALGKVHVKAYDLNAKTYDPFLKAEHRDEKRYEEEIKASGINVDPNILEQFIALNNQLSALQSARKMAATNINNDNKS